MEPVAEAVSWMEPDGERTSRAENDLSKEKPDRRIAKPRSDRFSAKSTRTSMPQEGGGGMVAVQPERVV